MPELRHPEARELRSGSTVQFSVRYTRDGTRDRRDHITALADQYPARTPRAPRKTAAGVPVEMRNGVPVKLYRPEHIVRAWREYEERERNAEDMGGASQGS